MGEGLLHSNENPRSPSGSHAKRIRNLIESQHLHIGIRCLLFWPLMNRRYLSSLGVPLPFIKRILFYHLPEANRDSTSPPWPPHPRNTPSSSLALVPSASSPPSASATPTFPPSFLSPILSYYAPCAPASIYPSSTPSRANWAYTRLSPRRLS